MYVGKQDTLAHPAVAQWTKERLPNVVEYIEYENYDHSSFAFGLDMKYLDNIFELF